MQYEKLIIDIYIVVYHLDPKNIHNPVGTNLNIINRVLAQNISTQ